MVKEGFGFGKSKIQWSMDFIREHEPPEGYFLGFSGGKDSVALLGLAKESGVKYKSFYSRTGIEPPELVHFIEREYPEVVHLRPKRSLFGKMEEWGYPTRRARWC